MRSIGLILLLAVAAICPVSLKAQEQQPPSELKRYSRTEPHMGVEFQIVLYANDPALAERALSRGMARVAELNKSLSDYDPESELSRLSATSQPPPDEGDTYQPIETKVGNDLWTVLAFAQEVSQKSGGAFDVTIGPLSKLWRRARRQKELPEGELLAAARAAVGYQHLNLNPEKQTATLLKPNMRLDLGGIAKGYAADEALKVVRETGITRALVRGSGDIAAGDPPPGEGGWKIGIAPLNPEDPPRRFLSLANRAVSTSGDSRQHLIVEGRRYSHLIDPTTGIGIAGRSSVTVIARRGIAADALDSAASILGPEKGLALIGKYPQTEAFIVYEDPSGKIHQVESDGFARYETDASKQ